MRQQRPQAEPREADCRKENEREPPDKGRTAKEIEGNADQSRERDQIKQLLGSGVRWQRRNAAQLNECDKHAGSHTQSGQDLRSGPPADKATSPDDEEGNDKRPNDRLKDR